MRYTYRQKCPEAGTGKMSGHGYVSALVLVILAVCSLGVIIGFLISTGRALKKFDRLDSTVQKKLLLLEYYMAVVRNVSKEDLIRLSTLPDEEISYFNTINGYDERIKTIKEKINTVPPGPF
jgi:hypothetical protein